ncbi:hypothetical protein TWF281_004780 [Arthrobotrys megalospora]
MAAISLGPDLENDMTARWPHDSGSFLLETSRLIPQPGYRNHNPDSGEDPFMYGVPGLYLKPIDDNELDALISGMEPQISDEDIHPLLRERNGQDTDFEVDQQSVMEDHSPDYRSRPNIVTGIPTSWDRSLPPDSAVSEIALQPPETNGFFNIDTWEAEPFKNNPLPVNHTDCAVVLAEHPTPDLTRRAPGRPAREPRIVPHFPKPRLGKRPYKENRQRIELNRARKRIKCGFNGCPYEFASAGTAYRHQQNTHLSKGRFGARCLYPGCEAERWAGTEPKAWDNLRTHQNQHHDSWVPGKTKKERCVIMTQLYPPN